MVGMATTRLSRGPRWKAAEPGSRRAARCGCEDRRLGPESPAGSGSDPRVGAPPAARSPGRCAPQPRPSRRRCAGSCAAETFRRAGSGRGCGARAGADRAAQLRRASGTPQPRGRPATLAAAGQNGSLAATRNTGTARSGAGRDILSQVRTSRGRSPPAPTDSGWRASRRELSARVAPTVWRVNSPRGEARIGRCRRCRPVPGHALGQRRRPPEASAGAETSAATSALPQARKPPGSGPSRPTAGRRPFGLCNPFFRLIFAYRNAINPRRGSGLKTSAGDSAAPGTGPAGGTTVRDPRIESPGTGRGIFRRIHSVSTGFAGNAVPRGAWTHPPAGL